MRKDFCLLFCSDRRGPRMWTSSKSIRRDCSESRGALSVGKELGGRGARDEKTAPNFTCGAVYRSDPRPEFSA